MARQKHNAVMYNTRGMFAKQVVFKERAGKVYVAGPPNTLLALRHFHFSLLTSPSYTLINLITAHFLKLPLTLSQEKV